MKLNKYITAIIAVITASAAEAQLLQPAPRLVVNITVDQLRTDYLEAFTSYYNAGGLKKLMQQGRIYEESSYPFAPVDPASAIACISTGTTPYYNSIIGTQWLDRNTLRPVSCTDDKKFSVSPSKIETSTIGDEMKVSSNGIAVVYAIAPKRESAVMAAGHAADGAFWIDEKTNKLTTSDYYGERAHLWLKAYRSINTQPIANETSKNTEIIKAAKACVADNSMGKDDICDLLSITLSAKGNDMSNWQDQMQSVYMQLDNQITELITNLEERVGKGKVLFIMTSTGYNAEENVDYEKYNIPTGIFYINRTANLLNVYLSAVYGQGRYIETCFRDEMYLNRKLIEQKRISQSDILRRCQEFLIQNAGVRDVFTIERITAGGNDIQLIRNGYNPRLSGDIKIEIASGWQLLNEDTHENYTYRSCNVPFPIILYGTGIKPMRISTPVTVDRIAPTIAKAIRIRAPNACKTAPLP